jgi:hypothetical protein
MQTDQEQCLAIQMKKVRYLTAAGELELLLD